MSNVELNDDILLCQPLKDLKSVLEWTPPQDSWAKLVIKKAERTSFCYRGSSPECRLTNEKLPHCSAPKTLLCHDMKGGYLEDRYVYGSDKHEEYRFTQWSSIDVFVYFSHHFITIPPLAWINSGHRHGVPVLGTIITEWKSGEAIWQEVLDDPSKSLELCEKLNQIANYYGFDGYLINVENTIKTQHVFALIDFVNILKNLLSSSNPDSLVYWYDSVIIPSGEIKYQNKLNGYNVGFFDVCDGIFLNYNWTKDDLVLSAKNGRDRLNDIFVGVDVFGRNCYGGGGFNTRLAVDMIGNHGLSVALFAPGWVHETLPKEENFNDRDYKFWYPLKPLMYVRGPATLPFETSFCQGYGERRYQQGIVVSNSPWYDLNKQEYQPTDLVGSDNESHCISHYAKNGFNGGSCLLVSKCSLEKEENEPVIHRLFVSEFKIMYNSVIKITLIISVVEYTSRPDLTLVLSLENGDGTQSRKVLCSEEEMEIWPEISDYVLPKHVTHLHESRMSTWEQRKFEFKLSNTTIVGIGCALGRDSPPILLGYLSIDAHE